MSAVTGRRKIRSSGFDVLKHTSNEFSSRKDPKSGKKIPNKLADAQRQQYYDALVQAEAAMHSAEAAIQQAQVAADKLHGHGCCTSKPSRRDTDLPACETGKRSRRYRRLAAYDKRLV